MMIVSEFEIPKQGRPEVLISGLESFMENIIILTP
jgi:hypothetical protein